MDLITTQSVIFTCAILLISGVLFGKLSYRLGVPLLLVFLIVGMCFGVDGLGLSFSDMHTAQSIGMITLCVILFSGGLETKYSSIKPVIAPGLVLSTVGVLLTALLTGIFAWWLSGMSWSNIHFAFMPSLLLAATMSSTDSASVFGILGSQKVGLKQNLRPMLELESGSNDPMAYMLTIILIEVVNLGSDLSALTLAKQLLMQFSIGGVLGYAMGKFAIWLIGRYKAMGDKGGNDEEQDSSMVSIMTLGCVFLTFTITDWIQGNGYLAVYLMGIVVGNAKIPFKRGLSRFVGGMSWFGQIVVFLMLGLLVNPHEMLEVATVSVLIGVFMILVGRPLSVLVCLLPFKKFTWQARTLVSWVGLRGAAPIIFATYPVVAGVEGSSIIFNIVFFVTLLSLVIQGTTIVRFSRKLGLIEKPRLNESDFGVELSESLPTALTTRTITSTDLKNGNTLRDMNIPAGQLVMMIRRGDKYIVPNGTLKLKDRDDLLIIENKKENIHNE